MHLSGVLALLSSALGGYVALLAWRFRRAPGHRDQGWFALVAATAAGYAALNAIITSPTASMALVLWGSKVQLLCLFCHAVGWFRYGSAFLGRAWRWELQASALAVSAASLLLLPGVGFTGRIFTRQVAALDLVYRDAEVTAFGLAVVAVALLVAAATVARFAAAWRRGLPHAGVHVAALGALAGMAAWDALNLLGVIDGIYLLDLGFLLPLAAVTFALSSRVVEESRALAALRGQLERAVEERTAELASSQEALHRAERLAALGQFSAGVSHEVSSPAAVVAANLRYLEEALRAGSPPADAQACLAESREAVERIARLTRQLLDASRMAASPQARATSVALEALVRQVLAAASPRLAGRQVVVEVAPDLAAFGQPEALAQVLDKLLDNAVRSLRPGLAGQVAIRGERALGRARLVVEDDGVGMGEETLSRAFDPFYSTRAFGSGSGLGLAVARGLLQSMRGDLRLESAPGRGTRAIVELPLASGAAAPALTPPSGSPPPTA